jgi:hypothetical protein
LKDADLLNAQKDQKRYQGSSETFDSTNKVEKAVPGGMAFSFRCGPEQLRNEVCYGKVAGKRFNPI